MNYVINHQEKIVIESCCECGINFGLPELLKDQLLENGSSFYCPNGHKQFYTQKTSLEKKLRSKENQLKVEREYSSRLYEEKEEFKKKVAAQKGQKTKILNRIKNGVCPHCNRSFEDLHNHMKTKHSDFKNKIN